MPLSPPANRTLRHRRAITAEAYAREDGLWDIEARLTDTKPRDIELAGGGIRPNGQPLHDLWLRVTIDLRMNVVDAEACSDWVPYPTHCDTIGPAYRKLIGLNLMKGFRKAVRERLSGVAGCTHLTELAGVLPTAAIQAFAGDVFNVRDGATVNDPNPEPPYQLHGCHALHFEGEVVRQFYPRWYGYQPAPKAGAAASSSQTASRADAPASGGDTLAHRPNGTSG
ncbi:hypothetical protein D3C81_1258330 [compost metagenome]|uniref:DUF2889 domain-containing protein n=1 Tax=Cupriavidus campinensis TaxID=151783 RepID=A0ABY3EPT9_9BURK|nr:MULTISPECIES: DUF2889 domain-containing protein [Cupriavidus]TSP12975.1 DUF2889 domain-containing protein [Cupriavidus campinensis]CAG2148673.1 hypothetical protein LMG19282_03400 [Cupriavidus campinensis]